LSISVLQWQVRNEDIQTGVKYGYPDYHTGQGVMVYATKKKTNQWLFLEPFSWEVWVFLFVAGELYSLVLLYI
jgi:hypothetical protein